MNGEGTRTAHARRRGHGSPAGESGQQGKQAVSFV